MSLPAARTTHLWKPALTEINIHSSYYLMKQLSHLLITVALRRLSPTMAHSRTNFDHIMTSRCFHKLNLDKSCRLQSEAHYSVSSAVDSLDDGPVLCSWQEVLPLGRNVFAMGISRSSCCSQRRICSLSTEGGTRVPFV